MKFDLSKHIDKKNMHHAYLLEGSRVSLTEEILTFLPTLGVKVQANPDFCHIAMDSLKIDDARNLRAMAGTKTLNDKKVFLICANSVTLDAQQTLLKLFEEPVADTHFFLVTEDASSFLPTLRSRFYLIAGNGGKNEGLKEAENFLKLKPGDRISYLKDLLEEDEENELLDSPRAKASRFLNDLEAVLHEKFFSMKSTDRNNVEYLEHIFKVRKFLRQSGSSVKSLMEGVALSIPSF